MTDSCATCGQSLQPGARFCAGCGAGVSVAAQSVERRGRPFAEIIVITLIVFALIGGVGYVLTRGMADNLIRDVADERADNGGNVSAANLPPAGTMWFGASFDTDTMEVRGRTTTVGQNEAFAGVASLRRSIDGSTMVMRVYFDGQLVTNTGANAEGTGDTWGWTLGPLFAAGAWRYEITDVGGNVLASGEITAE